MRRVGTGMMVVGWLLLSGVIWLGMDAWTAHQENPNADLAVDVPAGRVVLKRNAAGHFVAPGRINGVDVVYLVDTGATDVALSEDLARRVGATRGIPLRTETAGGETLSYATRLDSVRLGGLEAHGVAGAIVPRMGGHSVLLGMSFLSRFAITIHGDDMVISSR
jgi:aspartyl protease family protein